MSCVIASKRKEGVKQRGLPVERNYPLLESHGTVRKSGFRRLKSGSGAKHEFRRARCDALLERCAPDLAGIFPRLNWFFTRRSCGIKGSGGVDRKGPFHAA